jgi:hypothetical protein
VLATGKPVNETAVQIALNFACQQGGTATCAAIQAGGSCFEPNTLDAHASYAFNAYWQQFKKTGATCSFDGLAETTTKDPSKFINFPIQDSKHCKLINVGKSLQVNLAITRYFVSALTKLKSYG